ncbi:MAG TPA: O-antigen ligase family protein [Candidatus Paceibacterota bacterium]|nr:O-antigen ligase family protein [Candidatus Paceibacterota bacterium]
MEKVTKYIVLAALFIIPFLPLYVANGMFFPFITGKGFWFRILVEIAAVAWLALALLDAKYRPRFSWTLVLFGAFTAWMLIADLFAVNAHKALWSNFERMDGWVTLIHLFLFFLVAGSVLTADKLWKKWWLTFIGVSALVVGYSFIQLAGGADIHQGGVRVDANFGNATYLAVYLLFAIAVTCWLAFESKGWVRYLLGGLAVLQVIVLLNTATRGAILGLAGAALLCALLWLIGSGKRAKGIAAGAVLGLVVLIGGFWLVRNASFIQESPIFSRIASISLAEGATRMTLWSMALEGLAERPVLGYGQEGYNYIFNEYYRPGLYAQEPWFDRAHSVYVDWLVAGGIPGIILYLGLLLAATLALFRSPNIGRPERIFLIGALAAYAFQALFVFDNLFSYVPLAAVLAMAHAASARPIRKMEALPTVAGDTANATLAPVALVAAAALVWAVNIPNMSAAGHLVQAISPAAQGPAQNLEYFRAALADGSYATQEIREQLVGFTTQVLQQSQAAPALKAEFANLALGEIDKEIARAPGDARLYVQKSTLLRAAGDYEQAYGAIQEARRLSPQRQAFMLEEAGILVELKRTDEARDLFHAAYELDPSFDALAASAAAGDIYAGDIEAGKALLAGTFGTTSVNSPALVRAYYETKRYSDLIEVLRAAIIETNGSADARYRLATAYALAGRASDARAEANAAMAAYPATAAQGKAFLESLDAAAE